MLEDFDSLGIFTVELLFMVTKWRKSDHEQMARSVKGFIGNSVFRVLSIEDGQFSDLIQRGRSRMERERIGEQYQTAGAM
jgi:hypothetical protein